MGRRRTVVWKFPIRVGPLFATNLQMPKGARLLTVAYQGGGYVLWAEVDADREAPQVDRRIVSIGTGLSPNEEDHLGPIWEYVGTVFEGPFVWHIYDEGEIPLPEPG